MRRSTALPVLALACVLCGSGADWRQFRGSDATGVAHDETTPLEWNRDSGKNIAWTADLPGRGLSGPIVIGDRVVLTASSGYRQDRLHVLCFDSSTGEKLWERQFWATGRTMCHPKMCVATPTPASDGERIFAFYSSNDLVCLDLDGNLQWFRGLTYDSPNASNSLGMASSPIVIGKTVIVQVESEGDSFATGIDVATGIGRWKINRPRASNWTSPAILRGESPEKDLVLLQSGKGLTAYAPETGEEVWSFPEGCSTISSTAVAADLILAPSGGLTALRLPQGSLNPEVLWKEGRLSPSTASPIVFENHVYTVNRSGVLACASLADGKMRWQLRLKGPYSATPLVAGGHLYYVNEEGTTHVVKPGETKGEIVATNELGETILATPAAADGALYFRSDAHLWKIGGK